ncbi:hypothetical protein GCM10026986_22610 [Nitrincola alkalisediminis]
MNDYELAKLGALIQSQFKKKLAERLENPRVPADKLSGYDSVYKIKLRSAGYTQLAVSVKTQWLVVPFRGGNSAFRYAIA